MFFSARSHFVHQEMTSDGTFAMVRFKDDLVRSNGKSFALHYNERLRIVFVYQSVSGLGYHYVAQAAVDEPVHLFFTPTYLEDLETTVVIEDDGSESDITSEDGSESDTTRKTTNKRTPVLTCFSSMSLTVTIKNMILRQNMNLRQNMILRQSMILRQGMDDLRLTEVMVMTQNQTVAIQQQTTTTKTKAQATSLTRKTCPRSPCQKRRQRIPSP